MIATPRRGVEQPGAAVTWCGKRVVPSSTKLPTPTVANGCRMFADNALTQFKIIMVSLLPHSDQPKQRIIIHAGFAKCGSSSIQGTLFQNLKRLREDGIFLFDKNLRVAEDYMSLGTPLWVLEDAKRKREPLSQRLREEITAVTGANRQCIGVLSAENLADPKIAELFSGLDHEIEVRVVLYWRPQLQWIPSAWQQWGLKEGMPLDKFVSECIETHRPSYRLSIEKWKVFCPPPK